QNQKVFERIALYALMQFSGKTKILGTGLLSPTFLGMERSYPLTATCQHLIQRCLEGGNRPSPLTRILARGKSKMATEWLWYAILMHAFRSDSHDVRVNCDAANKGVYQLQPCGN